PAYKVRPAKDKPPYRWETGTASFESIMATGAAVRYLRTVGEQFGAEHAAQFSDFTGARLHYKTGMETLRAYEKTLGAHLIERLQAIQGVTIYGITDPNRYD